jgi:hypothetical protein
MRLSTAIALGRTVIEQTDPHSFCGCALAMGLLGVGKEPCVADLKQPFSIKAAQASLVWRQTQCIVWPWLNENRPFPEGLLSTNGVAASCELPALNLVSDLFFAVERKKITLDQLIDWVRSVEPPELEEAANGDSAQTIAATNPVCPQKIFR